MGKDIEIEFTPKLKISNDEITDFFNNEDEKRKIRDSIEKYLNVVKPDDPNDKVFQSRYSRFYRMVRRKREWKEKYFKLLCTQKTNPKEVGDILAELYEPNKYIEISFASKMIATYDTKAPLVDNWVLKNLGLDSQWNKTRRNWGNDKEERIKCAVELYKAIEKWYKSDNSIVLIDKFDTAFPKNKKTISDTKKIDLILWRYREKDE